MLMWRLIIGALSVSFAYGATCQSPKATTSYYSTKDAFFHMSTTFIVEFVLNCQNDVQDLPLYAEVRGKMLPVAISEETSKYQLSWTEEHENAPAGKYIVNVYDDDGYAAVRKAQRTGDDYSNMKSLFSVQVDHPGSSSGPYIASETVMLVVAIVVFYISFLLKNNLKS